MRWFKTLIVLLFLGVYFFNITPMHFILHDIGLETSHNQQPLEDCKYVKLVAQGQDTFLNSDSFTVIESLFLEPINRYVTNKLPHFISSRLKSHKLLRAPPIA